MKKLRLLLFEECNRRCKGCCNQYFDITTLPYADSFTGYDEVILTGGEPMLKPDVISKALIHINKQHHKPIYLYTAKVDNIPVALSVLLRINGMTVTLHEQKDLAPWVAFNAAISKNLKNGKKLRLNVFAEVDMSGIDTTGWVVQDNIVWIENCPLPEDEVFLRFKSGKRDKNVYKY